MKYVILLIYLLLSCEVNAQSMKEKAAARDAKWAKKPPTTTTTTKGYVTPTREHYGGYVDLKTTTKPNGESRTKGWVDGKYVDVKSKEKKK